MPYTFDQPVAVQLTSAIIAKGNCERMGAATHNDTNREHYATQVEHYATQVEHYATQVERWNETIQQLIRECLPNGTSVVEELCTGSKLVLETQFHYMNGAGFYDGWTSHRVTITPSFVGSFNLTVSGRNRNGIKDYIGDVFYDALSKPPVDYTALKRGAAD